MGEFEHVRSPNAGEILVSEYVHERSQNRGTASGNCVTKPVFKERPSYSKDHLAAVPTQIKGCYQR